MTKTMLFQKIYKEIDALNNQIDAKILKGLAYKKEARRHKDLLLTLQRIDSENIAISKKVSSLRRHSKLGKSPIRRVLEQSAGTRIFGRKFAF